MCISTRSFVTFVRSCLRRCILDILDVLLALDIIDMRRLAGPPTAALITCSERYKCVTLNVTNVSLPYLTCHLVQPPRLVLGVKG
eukprot:9102431-Pyramimonas_sp.AAC.1